MSRLERIVAALGGILMDGGKRALIPGPDHSTRDRSVSLRETEEGRILIHCFSLKDDWRDVRRALQQQGLLDEAPLGDRRGLAKKPAVTVAQPDNEDRVARARRIWDEGVSLRHSPARAYLARRAITHLGDADGALRFHARMTSLDDRLRRPALLAAIVDAAGALQGVQATLLSRHGVAKAAVATPRRVIGKLMGGSVRLSEGGDALLVGEGVETMLSASAALALPAWALLTADNLSGFVAPGFVRRLIVAVDDDSAGHAAASALKARHSIPVALELPPGGADDWNAWAMRR